MIEVVNSRVYSNPYQKLLYSAIGHRYRIVPGSVNKAIAQHRAMKRSLYHIHWEESLFAKCTAVAEAMRLRQEYIARLRHYVGMGGKVVWTLHNIKPHEGKFVQTLFTLRKELASLSHRILVHNEAALETLKHQTGLTDLSKVTVLPHPTYFDIYEPSAQSQKLAGKMPVYARTLLHFGMVRAYKGIPDLVRKLAPEFMAQHRLALHICGQPHRADSFLDNLLSQTEGRSEIKYSLDAVPTEAVANLLRSHAGLIIPYHNVLTSGVAVLSLTLGVPTIAPNTLSMRELYPKSSHHLLFNPRSPKDLRRAVLELVDMSAHVRKRIAQDYMKQAFEVRPSIISNALGAIYDELLGFGNQDSTIESASSGQAFSSLRKSRSQPNDVIGQSRVPFLFQLISENEAMATRASKATAVTLSNEQLALELVKATLLGNAARSGASDELILNNTKKDVNKFTVERARLDGAYAVRLYQNILSRLELSAAELASTASNTGEK